MEHIKFRATYKICLIFAFSSTTIAFKLNGMTNINQFTVKNGWKNVRSNQKIKRNIWLKAINLTKCCGVKMSSGRYWIFQTAVIFKTGEANTFNFLLKDVLIIKDVVNYWFNI